MTSKLLRASKPFHSDRASQRLARNPCATQPLLVARKHTLLGQLGQLLAPRHVRSRKARREERTEGEVRWQWADPGHGGGLEVFWSWYVMFWGLKVGLNLAALPLPSPFAQRVRCIVKVLAVNSKSLKPTCL